MRGGIVFPSEIASIASAFSGVTATVSLIYVGIQIRLSMRHTRAQIQQGTTARTTSILLGQMNADAAAIWIEGNGGTPTAELVRERQFYCQCGIAMIAMEDYFSQHELSPEYSLSEATAKAIWLVSSRIDRVHSQDHFRQNTVVYWNAFGFTHHRQVAT